LISIKSRRSRGLLEIAMNVYKNLLFLHGHFTDPRMDDGYGPSYGNRTANARSLRETWQSPREAVAANEEARRPDDVPCRACGQAGA
jgi:hypothetical protein